MSEVDETNLATSLEKGLAAGGLCILSAVFGFLPLFLKKKYDFGTSDSSDPLITKNRKKLNQNVILSFLLNLGGGILLANAFLHWLPESRERFVKDGFVGELPYAELIMCGGYFFICVAEELLHHFLHPLQESDKKTAIRSEEKTPNGTKETASTGADEKDCCLKVYAVDVDDCCVEAECCEEDSEKRTAAQIKSAIRTFFIISALSFHSVIEGLALSLEQSKIGIWMVTGAVALHKFVIAFSLGVELIANKAKLFQYYISIIIFSLAPAIGAGIGIILSDVADGATVSKLALQIIQDIATGTVVYVIFQEIFPKAKEIGGTGAQHIIAQIIGFSIFLPSLYWHNWQMCNA